MFAPPAGGSRGFTPVGSLPGARGDRVTHWSPTRRWGPRRRGSLGHPPANRRQGQTGSSTGRPPFWLKLVVSRVARHLLLAVLSLFECCAPYSLHTPWQEVLTDHGGRRRVRSSSRSCCASRPGGGGDQLRVLVPIAGVDPADVANDTAREVMFGCGPTARGPRPKGTEDFGTLKATPL